MSRTLKLTLILLFLVKWNSFGLAFQKYNVDNGLSENTVQAILQDEKGFMWFGTKDGLNRFDGVRFKTYRSVASDPTSIGNNFIRCIFQRGSNTLWVGTDLGIYELNTHTDVAHFFGVKTQEGKPLDDCVCSICEDDAGNIWIGAYSGLYVYSKAGKTLRKIRPGTIGMIIKDKAGTVWFTTTEGLVSYTRETRCYELHPLPGVYNQEILCIHEDSDGDLWLGTWNQGVALYRKSDRSVKFYFDRKSRNYLSHVRAIHEYRKSQMLVGADDGFYLLDKKTGVSQRVDNLQDPNSLSDQNVYTICKDREEGFWVGTYFGGVNYLPFTTNAIENFYPIPNKNSLSGKAVSQFCEDASGNVWIATEDGGLNYFNTTTRQFKSYQPRGGGSGLSYHNLHALLLDGEDLWIGTFSRGIDILNVKTGQFRHLTHRADDPYSLVNDCVFSFLRTSDGTIYVGTSLGVCRYDRVSKRFVPISRVKGLVYDMGEDSLGNLWFITYGYGIYRYDRTGKWREYSIRTGKLVFDKLTDIYIDPRQRVWIASEGRGVFLYHYDRDNFTVIDKDKGLPNNVIYGVVADPYGKIWISSNGGITRMDPGTLQMQTFTKENGLLSKQFNYKSSFVSKKGLLYFGGINGFSIIRPGVLVNNNHTPQVGITGFEFLNKEKAGATDSSFLYQLKVEKKIVLKQSQASFKIEFVSLSYRTPYKNQYAYRLEKRGGQWINLGNQTSVSFVNLPPGSYRFRIIGSNDNGVWNETGDYLDIVVRPSVWRSLPMIFLYVLLILVAAYSLVRTYNQRRREREKFRFDELQIEREKELYNTKIRFFTNIAHEIRTPVSLISAPLEGVLAEDGFSHGARDNLQVIKRNSDRLLDLINQLLDFRKIEEHAYKLHLVRTNVGELLSEIVLNFGKATEEKGLDVRLSLPDGESYAYLDREVVTKIVSNLMSNAVKHARRSIILDLQVSGGETGERIRISLRDDGPGIPKGLEKMIFEPFYQIEGSPGNVRSAGTGIGLAFARQLAIRHKGTLDLEEGAEPGACFVLTLPGRPEPENLRESEETVKPWPQAEETAEGQFHKPSVLVVEDNDELRTFVVQNLKGEYRVHAAANGVEALQILEFSSADLIVSDVMMPEMDGFELVRKIRQDDRYCHIPVLLLSALADTNSKVEGLEYGADGYLEKPFSMVHLKAQVHSLIRNRERLMERFSGTPAVSYQLLANNPKDKEFLDRLDQEIDRNMQDEDFNIEKLAVTLAMSRSKLQRKIKELSGMVPNDYIRVTRLKKAAALLVSGAYKINEICFLVGFNSPSYFSKCFMKQFGCLPKDYPPREA